MCAAARRRSRAGAGPSSRRRSPLRPARSAAHIGLYSQDPGGRVPHPAEPSTCGSSANRTGPARRRAESLALAEELGPPVHPRLCPDLGRDPRSVFAASRAAPATQADAAIALGREHRMPFWRRIATTVRGWAIAEEGGVAAGVDEIGGAWPSSPRPAAWPSGPFQLGLLAEQLGHGGAVDAGSPRSTRRSPCAPRAASGGSRPTCIAGAVTCSGRRPTPPGPRPPIGRP